MDFRNIAMSILNQNQNGINQNLPFASAGIQAIRNNDSKKGEEIANNILRSCGITKEQAMEIARQRGIIR